MWQNVQDNSECHRYDTKHFFSSFKENGFIKNCVTHLIRVRKSINVTQNVLTSNTKQLWLGGCRWSTVPPPPPSFATGLVNS